MAISTNFQTLWLTLISFSYKIWTTTAQIFFITVKNTLFPKIIKCCNSAFLIQFHSFLHLLFIFVTSLYVKCQVAIELFTKNTWPFGHFVFISICGWDKRKKQHLFQSTKLTWKNSIQKSFVAFKIIIIKKSQVGIFDGIGFGKPRNKLSIRENALTLFTTFLHFCCIFMFIHGISLNSRFNSKKWIWWFKIRVFDYSSFLSRLAQSWEIHQHFCWS